MAEIVMVSLVTPAVAGSRTPAPVAAPPAPGAALVPAVAGVRLVPATPPPAGDREGAARLATVVLWLLPFCGCAAAGAADGPATAPPLLVSFVRPTTAAEVKPCRGVDTEQSAIMSIVSAPAIRHATGRNRRPPPATIEVPPYPRRSASGYPRRDDSPVTAVDLSLEVEADEDDEPVEAACACHGDGDARTRGREPEPDAE